jgi:hypothetical protein
MGSIPGVDKLVPVFRAPQTEAAFPEQPAPVRIVTTPPCASRRQRRFERRLAERRATQVK